MKLVISLTFFLFTILSTFSQCGFYYKSLSSSFNKVKFWDESNGVVLGYNASLLSTEDGGKSWKNANIPMFQSLYDNPLNDISIADQNTAIVVGDMGVILKTTDKGKKWVRLIAINGSEKLKGVHFWNNQNGVVVGNEGLILKTSDGGNVWQKISSGFDGDFKGVYFVDNKKGFAWGTGGFANAQSTYTTNDGGETWQLLTTLNNKYITKMQFTSASVGYVSVYFTSPINTGTAIYKTTDGGKNWAIPAFNNFFDGPAPFSFIDDQTGYVAYYGLIKKTSDGAVNFSQSLNLGKYKFNDICFVNSKVGYAVGTSNSFLSGNGRFLVKTTDGGIQWTILDTLHKTIESLGSNRAALDIFEYSATTKFISTSGNNTMAVFVSRDGGSSWQGDPVLSDNDIRGTGKILKNGILVFNSKNKYFTSSDSGKNWTSFPLNLPPTSAFDISSPYPISWISIDTFYMPSLTDTGIKIFYTTNKAISWSAINVPSGLIPFSKRLFKFINKDTAFISGYVGDNARLYRTYNKGVTWQNLNYPDSVGIGPIPIDPDLINDSSIIIRSIDRRSFYKTKNRGDNWTTVALPAVASSLYINMFDFYTEKTGIFSDNNQGVYSTGDSGKTWFQQITGLLASSSDNVRSVSINSEERFYALGDNLRLEQFENYIPEKPSLIKGSVIVKQDSIYEYIIPLDLFSFDTKWEATGNALLAYDSANPERVIIKWTSPGNFKVMASSKTYCGNSAPAELSVKVSSNVVPIGSTSPNDYVAYPIPANNQLFIKFKQAYQYDNIRIFDLSGRVVYSKKIDASQIIEIKLDTLAAGNYILSLYSSNGQHSSMRKIVKL